ncbi:MAG: pilus assembly protein TadG-related protein [Desulfobaccales bacterium]
MKLAKFGRDTEGAIASITALLLTVAVGAMSIAIDLGHIFLVRCELQRAADAGAMAGAIALLGITPGSKGPVTLNPDCGRSLTACQRVVAANTADGGTLSLNPDADVIFGTWDMAAKAFNPIGCANPNLVTAVKVITRKDVALSFSKILPGGMSSKDLTAEAIGLTGYPGSSLKSFPLAVDVNKVPPNNTPFRIHLNPNPGDDGAWHSYKDQNTNANDLRQYVDGTKDTPPISVGDNIFVQNGVDDSVLKTIADQLASKTAAGETYDVLVPIIPAGEHSTTAEVQGFATLEITEVVTQGGDKYIEAHIVPNFVAPGTLPGGPNYGTLVYPPKMVL